MKRNASAQWRGGLKDGKGTISTDSGVLQSTQYSYQAAFDAAAEKAKEGCPISKLLKAEITMYARLEA